MKKSIWFNLDDLIFEGRNKFYGAYALRREYPRRLAIAFFAVIGLLILSLPLPEYLNRNTTFPDIVVPAKPKDKVIEIVIPNLEDKQKTELPSDPVAPAAKSTVSKSTNTTAVINFVDEQTASTLTTEIVTGGTENNGTITGSTETAISGVGTETGTGTGHEFAEPQIENFAEILPQYPGGDAELVRQINKAIRYPKEALAAGVSGTVFVSFVVDKQGNVSRLQIVKGIGSGCDEEALRVIGQLKGWSPAIQNGNPVFFKYVMPVKFVIR